MKYYNVHFLNCYIFVKGDTAFFNIILYFEPWPVFVVICFIIDINLYSKIMKANCITSYCYTFPGYSILINGTNLVRYGNHANLLNGIILSSTPCYTMGIELT